ncbi:hypothetical protein ACVR0A_04090, partial [Streptococcus downei]
ICVIVTVHEVAFLLFFCQRYFIKTTYVKQKATASKPLLFRWLRDSFVPTSFYGFKKESLKGRSSLFFLWGQTLDA